MKKYYFKSAVMLIMIASVLSCSSDSGSASCEPITCVNGGISTSNCGCDCPVNYTGENCSIEVPPTKITITKIRVKEFPNSAAGIDDFGTNPDVFIALSKSSSLIYTAPSYSPDMNGNGSFYSDFTLPLGIFSNTTSTIFSLEFWDYDDTSSNDLMGTIYFSPYVSIDGLGFPSSFIISASGFKAEIFVTYEW